MKDAKEWVARATENLGYSELGDGSCEPYEFELTEEFVRQVQADALYSALEIVRAEHLHDKTGEETDEAYDAAVADCVSALARKIGEVEK